MNIPTQEYIKKILTAPIKQPHDYHEALFDRFVESERIDQIMGDSDEE